MSNIIKKKIERIKMEMTHTEQLNSIETMEN